jgi:hypothetical protein
MSGTGYRNKWLRAGKVLEYYIDGGPWLNSPRDAEYQLYNAVMEGEIRARIGGKPWQQATGPRSSEGKAIVSRNAFKGGRRVKMRQLMRELKHELAGQREFLDNFSQP